MWEGTCVLHCSTTAVYRLPMFISDCSRCILKYALKKQ